MTKEQLLKMTDGARIGELLNEFPELKDGETIAHSMKMLAEARKTEGRDPNILYDPVPKKDSQQ